MIANEIRSLNLLDTLPARIRKQFPPTEAQLIIEFAQKLLSNLPLEPWSQEIEDHLYGLLLSLWNHTQHAIPGDISLRIYNPQLKQHGWQGSCTIVEIVLPDRPFVVDSLCIALQRLQIRVHRLLHGPFPIVRRNDGTICSFDPHHPQATYTAICQIEIDLLQNEAKVHTLTRELRQVLNQVARAVDDWPLMQQHLKDILATCSQYLPTINEGVQRESCAFIEWILAGNFILLGYRGFILHVSDQTYSLQPEVGSSLGIARSGSEKRLISLATFSESARCEMERPTCLILTKANHRSRIHRAAYLDYIGIKRFSATGTVIGEDRFVGLYTSSTYVQSARQIPLIRYKVEEILSKSGLYAGSHAYKAMAYLLESMPRDELIQAHAEALYEIVRGIYQIRARDTLRLFIRRDPYGHFFSCLVYLSIQRYATSFIVKTQALLKRALNSTHPVEYRTLSRDETLICIHYLVWVRDNSLTVNVQAIENDLIEAASSWEDRLAQALYTRCGEQQGTQLQQRYMEAFPRAYQDSVPPNVAVDDILHLEAIGSQQPLNMHFYSPLQQERNDTAGLKLKLFKQHDPLPLSDIMPVLENLGLKVIGETPYAIYTQDQQRYWILDFQMTHQLPLFDLTVAQERLQEALAGIWFGHYENDGLNRLILSAGLSAREVVILRAYARYLRQTGTLFSQHYIERALTRHADLASFIVQLFHCRFNPQTAESFSRTVTTEQIKQQIQQALESVTVLDEDRIIHRYMEMVLATVRTNFFQRTPNGQVKSWIAFKLLPEKISEMPLPLPRFEIFVYSPNIEGVHLRGGKTARGGIRWSDRLEDFRIEVLGLMKAQQVKNSVIVPVGAKGGFVCKRILQDQEQDQQTVLEEGKRCYQTFIRALLDVTDNIVQGQVVPPPQVVRYDDDDYYLVVAADKGTATFSDLSNAIAIEYGFWLGDAFASGGSFGYDHKKMGITALGAWESVKRHFRELGIDCQQQPFTCIAIGDMSGDVFGNGLLQSPHLHLIAAFNHRHIFIDPQPDAQRSYQERQRLFQLPCSSWTDYNPQLISEGGGVFRRTAKVIPLSASVRALLDTTQQAMTPNALIHALLQLSVDLLWNGGIGTYVKARQENHNDVGDRANDTLRINGSQLRVRVVGEGGNLGLTQWGRIEYALQGGRLNTDFIDNMGGVDCSDNEVNIKILLNALIDKGELTLKQRNELLEEMQEDIASLVLNDARQQARAISVIEHQGIEALRDMTRLIHLLERNGHLNRTLECLPSDEELNERLLNQQGLTRPEIAVLVAYSKMVLKQALVADEITNDPIHKTTLLNHFPMLLQKRFSTAVEQHPLRSELIATHIANQIVNDMGANLCHRLQEETGATLVEVVNAYTAARSIFAQGEILATIESFHSQIPTATQYELIITCQKILRRATRWLLRNRSCYACYSEMVHFFQPAVRMLSEAQTDYLVPEQAAEYQCQIKHYQQVGVPEPLALQIVQFSSLYCTLDIAEIAAEQQYPLSQVAQLYFQLGHELELHWFLNQINSQAIENHWQALARASFREELTCLQRQLTAEVLSFRLPEERTTHIWHRWCITSEGQLVRWRNLLTEFKLATVHEFAKFSVVLHELRLLLNNS